MCAYISTPPATGPLHVGSSWPEQEMGTFGSFLYINEFFGDESLFGCPPSVGIMVGRCGANWGQKRRGSAVRDEERGPKRGAAPQIALQPPIRDIWLVGYLLNARVGIATGDKTHPDHTPRGVSGAIAGVSAGSGQRPKLRPRASRGQC